MKPGLNRCCTCRFAVDVPGDFEADCRRYPPRTILAGANIRSDFPKVRPGWWCGEYQSDDDASEDR